MMCKKAREQMLREISEVSFAVNDIHLFLNTHPCDEKAMSYFREMNEKRNDMLHEFAEAYGPLTISEAGLSENDTWKWMEQPFPWEKEGAWS